MRPIKFRGKSLTGEWSYGYLQEYQETMASKLCICAASVRTWHDALLYEVKPETVGQFTGLHDKDGKEIYEGDITQYDNITELVVFENGAFCLSRDVDTGKETVALLAKNRFVRVVGNVHDNPELLTDVQK